MSQRRNKLSPVVQSIPPSGIRRFFDLVMSTEGVISLGVGEPDFVTPWHIREASMYALERGYTTYTSNHGLMELREAVADYLDREYFVSYRADNEVMITVGASEAIDLAFRALICPGDEVLIPEPSYVSYRPLAILAGGLAVGVPTYEEDGFRLKAEHLRAAITERSKLLVLCYPNNPTGATMSKEDLEPIAEVVEEHDLIVIADEIYAELTYNGKHTSFASLPGMRDRTVLVSGLSKAFAMTGWRIGYAAAPEDILSAMVKIHQYSILCAPIMGQMAALEALRNGQTEKDRMVSLYDQRRRLIVNGFREMGLSCHEPNGAFYAFPSIKETGMTSAAFAELLLHEAKVAVVPGNVFGEGGEGFIRCSYATSIQHIQEALDRISRVVRRIHAGSIR
jgi:aminotransferase